MFKEVISGTYLDAVIRKNEVKTDFLFGGIGNLDALLTRDWSNVNMQ